MLSSDIAEQFKDRFSQKESLPDKMPLEEIMSNWHQNLENEDSVLPKTTLEDVVSHRPPEPGDREVNEASIYYSMDQESNDEADEEETGEINKPEHRVYRDLIFQVPAYEWLLTTLRREFRLTPAEPNIMEIIRREIIHSLPSSHKVSRKRPAEAYKVVFTLDWDPLAFIIEQEYEEEPDEAIEIAITLTGSTKDAQALTCTQYMCQTWQSTGQQTIQLIKDVVRSGPGCQHICISQCLIDLILILTACL